MRWCWNHAYFRVFLLNFIVSCRLLSSIGDIVVHSYSCLWCLIQWIEYNVVFVINSLILLMVFITTLFSCVRNVLVNMISIIFGVLFLWIFIDVVLIYLGYFVASNVK